MSPALTRQVMLNFLIFKVPKTVIEGQIFPHPRYFLYLAKTTRNNPFSNFDIQIA
jgi:hypothetical protein